MIKSHFNIFSTFYSVCKYPLRHYFNKISLPVRNHTAFAFNYIHIAIKNGWLTLDEVRTTENLEALNLDFIKLGLDSVIYYYKDKKIYIPNTKEFVDVEGGGKNEN